MNIIIPALLIIMLAYSLKKGVGVYEAFVRGAAEALPLIVKILPYMASMMIALNIFRDSGVLEFIIDMSAPVLELVAIPKELAPLIILRPFSGSATMALLNDLFVSAGPDSFASFAGAVTIGSTETIFYTIALYFGSVGVKKTRHAIPVALLSGVTGIAAGMLLSALFYPGAR